MFLLGSTVIPRETEDNDYVIFFYGGIHMVYYGYFFTYLNGGKHLEASSLALLN